MRLPKVAFAPMWGWWVAPACGEASPRGWPAVGLGCPAVEFGWPAVGPGCPAVGFGWPAVGLCWPSCPSQSLLCCSARHTAQAGQGSELACLLSFGTVSQASAPTDGRYMVRVGRGVGGVTWSFPVPLLEVMSGQLRVAHARSYTSV